MRDYCIMLALTTPSLLTSDLGAVGKTSLITRFSEQGWQWTTRARID